MAKQNAEPNGINKLLLALGLKEYVKTASEDDIANVINIGVAMDESTTGKDADEHPKGCRCNDCKGTAKDAKTGMDADDRKRLHDALDRALDGKEEEQAAQDADMEQLRGLLAGGASSQKAKNSAIDSAASEEEQAKVLEAEAEEEESEAEGEDSEDEEEGEGNDEAVQSEASPRLPAEARTKSPMPTAVDAATVLRALKPFVAGANNTRLNKAFDTASQLVRGTAKAAGKTSYVAVNRASKAVGKDAADQLDRRSQSQKIADEANAAYKSRLGKNKADK